MNKDKQIYLDYQATTPTDPRVIEVMMDCYKNHYGNPHSRSHIFGWEAEAKLEEARKVIADFIHAGEKDIIFTSGATEANNLAIKGVAHYYKEQEGKDHIITVITEHKCILESCRYLERQGFKVTYLKVGTDGLINLQDLENAITPQTCLISVMMLNNEIGVIQPIKEIGAICNKHNILFHTDAAQAYGKIPINVDEMNIDLMSITAHKIYGPVGIGALYVRRKPKRVRLQAIFSGGGQERGFRSGTLPLALIVGFAKATEIAVQEMEKDKLHVEKLFNHLYKGIFDNLEHVFLNGSATNRYFGNANISFAYIEGESLLMALKNLAVSSGSACTSASLEASYVLKALGLSEELAHTSIRFGFGRFTTEEEIDYVIEITKKAVVKLRELSPLWEMVQEGIDLDTIEWSGH